MAIKISGTTVVDDSRNIGNVGVATATLFSGDGSGLSGVGVGTEGSINTSGIITATKFSAQKFVGFGDKIIFGPTPTAFSPTDGATDVALDTNIVLTFNQPIYAGVGSIFLRNSSGIGTEIEAIGITSSMINNQTLTINPSSNLPIDTDVYVVLPIGVVKNSAVNGNNALLDTYNFTTLNFTLDSINPTDGATNVDVDTDITLSFNNVPTRGTGTVELRSGSVGGSLIESFDAASSGQISISGNDWILNPSSNLSYTDTVYTIIPSTAIVNYEGLNIGGGTASHSFTLKGLPALGSSFEGGTLICKSGGVGWVVATTSAIVCRNWYDRAQANTRAQQVSGCTGWFVPTCGQIQNPGYQCRTYWDCCGIGNGVYWSNSPSPPGQGVAVNAFSNSVDFVNNKPNILMVRSFRCVSY